MNTPELQEPTREQSLYEAGSLVSSLRSCMTRAGSLDSFPGLLRRILRGGFWRERTEDRLGPAENPVCFDTFKEFVVHPPLEGLGADLSTVKRLAGSDPELLALYDEAVQRPHGGDRKSQAARIKVSNAHLDCPTTGSAQIKVDIINLEKPTGTSAQRAHRVLREKAPELHAKVLAGDMSAHAAMIEGGFRQKTWSLPKDIDALGAALVRRLPPGDLSRLADLIAAGVA